MSITLAGALLMMPVAVCSFLFLWTAAVCYQAVLVDTANGYDRVEHWPGVNFLDWMGEALLEITGSPSMLSLLPLHPGICMDFALLFSHMGM